MTPLDKAKAINIHDVDRPRQWRHRMCSPANISSHFLDHVCKSATVNANICIIKKVFVTKIFAFCKKMQVSPCWQNARWWYYCQNYQNIMQL